MKPKEPDLARVSFCLKDNALRLVAIAPRYHTNPPTIAPRYYTRLLAITQGSHLTVIATIQIHPQ
jgi:hypothetical protein